MSSTKTILGLDVSKDKLDACLLTTPQPRTLTVPNTPKGHAQLLAWAVDSGPLHLCLEATSTYGFPVARHAHAAGHTVSVLQPLAVARYAQATLSRNKTDRLDAALIADFGRTQNPRPWTPPSPAQEQLQAQSRLRDELVQQRHGLQNRLDTAHASVVPVLRSLVRSLERQIEKLTAALVVTLAGDSALRPQAELLRTIPGVGPVLCAGLLAELPADLRTARAATAYAGLNPRQRQSGTSLRGRAVLSKLGNARLRRLLYVPALCGLQHNPVLRALDGRLAARGKPGKVRVGAVMRKLLCLGVGVLRSGQPWQPTGRPRPKTAPVPSSP
jgi:transposase